MTAQATQDKAESPLHERFLDAGMRVLARDGYAGFKQAAVCAETGLTTGAFYHSFPSWNTYEVALINHWRDEATTRMVAALTAIDDPLDRIQTAIAVALELPHQTEAAIRNWAARDEHVREVLSEVDQERIEVIAAANRGLCMPPDQALHNAHTAMMLLIGFEHSGTPLEEFEWSMRYLIELTLNALASGTDG